MRNKGRIIGILGCLSLLTLTLLSVSKEREETVTAEIIETNELPRYITDIELSKLYTCRPDIRKNSDTIVEVSYEEAQILMAVAKAEGGESVESQFWIMRTIYNRYDAEWEDSLWEILTQDGQFEVISNERYKKADIDVDSHLALARLEMGENPTQGALYWESNSNSPDSWHKRNLTFIKEVGGNLFYRKQ